MTPEAGAGQGRLRVERCREHLPFSAKGAGRHRRRDLPGLAAARVVAGVSRVELSLPSYIFIRSLAPHVEPENHRERGSCDLVHDLIGLDSYISSFFQRASQRPELRIPTS